MYLNILILFSAISVIHCCGKQTPPNFGVPVFKPPDSNDDNYTVKKDILIREERSVTGKYRHKNAFYYSLEEDDTPAESSHNDIKGSENSYGKSQSAILNVIRTVLSESRHPELTHNRDTVPSKQKHKTDDVPESEIQFETSANRIKRDTSEQDVRNSLPHGSVSEAADDGKQEGEESGGGGGGGGWNAKTAVLGFVLAAAMLVGITCFIR